MKWYVAHVVMSFRQKDGEQTEFAVWENFILVAAASAEDAFDEGERLGREQEGDDSGSLTTDGRPAKRTFEGVRKVMEILDYPSANDALRPGVEVSYSEYLVTSEAALRALATGKEADVRCIA